MVKSFENNISTINKQVEDLGLNHATILATLEKLNDKVVTMDNSVKEDVNERTRSDSKDIIDKLKSISSLI